MGGDNHNMSSVTETSPKQQTPQFDPEYLQWLMSTFPADETPPPLGTIQEMRQNTEEMIRALFAQFPSQPTITQTSHTITSSDGTPIKVIRFSPPSTNLPTQEPQPAILHFHGGGHCANSVSIIAPALSELASLTSLPIFSVEYRLAPEHPFPASLNDGYAALTWLSSSAAVLGIDASRIAVMGDSSGGGLAAGVALKARDEGFAPAIKKMLLVYPMLDDRSITLNPAWDAANRTVKLLTMCWDAYLGLPVGVKAGDPSADVSPYAAPGRAASVEGLPEAYVEVGALDEFREECEVFVRRLGEVGVVEGRVWEGVPHGFDAARDTGVARRAVEGRVAWLKGL